MSEPTHSSTEPPATDADAMAGQRIWIGPGRFQEPGGSAIKAVWINCLEIERQ